MIQIGNQHCIAGFDNDQVINTDNSDKTGFSANQVSMRLFNKKLQEIQDPVVRDFAFSELESLRKELFENDVMPKDITAVKDDIKKRFSIIYKRAENEAEAWKQSKRTELKSESNMLLLNMYAERMESEKKENPQVIEKLLSKIEETKKQIHDDQERDIRKSSPSPSPQTAAMEQEKGRQRPDEAKDSARRPSR